MLWKLELTTPENLADLHLIGKGALTAQYVLVLDALNFCFWLQPDLEYEHLARGLKVSIAI